MGRKRRRRRPSAAPAASSPYSFGDHLGAAVTALLGCILCFVLGGVDIAPAWAAHEGHGTRGTWTATGNNCARTCDWVDTFTPTAAGTAKRDVKDDGADSEVTVGTRLPAVDTGAQERRTPSTRWAAGTTGSSHSPFSQQEPSDSR
ncbi:hypothetical protein [Streptacidiphilus albus]|uniref:hypothetical protein n=1 Tax=Streptacidiphilus albus TaxID=105425 RepID=UPI00054B8B6A|nr:hypothetical protein [Streptacidiphilus albus]